MSEHDPIGPGEIASGSTQWPKRGNSCADADNAADEQIRALTQALAEAEWMRDHWERCFNEANDSAVGALRALRARVQERAERGVVCAECGALVYEKTWHREWHRDLEGQR